LEHDAASLDVHMGQHFLLPRRAMTGYLDPMPVAQENASELALRPTRGVIHPGDWAMVLERLSIPVNGELFLHPGQFALAAVYEYIRLPLDLCADVLGRSSWARVGLVIAMATFVHPGYSGCLTLELQNLGQVPIRLKPGLRVAQLVFREARLATTRDEAPDSVAAGHRAGLWPAGQLACSYAPEYWPVVSGPDRDLLEDLDTAAQ